MADVNTPVRTPLTTVETVDLTEICERQMSQWKSMIATLEMRIRDYQEIQNILKGIRRAWADEDPGKYSVATWFLTRDGRRCIPREMVPSGVVVHTKETYKAMRAKQLQRGTWKVLPEAERGIPPTLPVVAMSDVLMAPCPSCKRESPVLQVYYQSEDGPDGDEWVKKNVLLCCDRVKHLESTSRENRF